MADRSTYQADNSEIVLADKNVNFHERVIKQINEEYWASWWFHQPRKQEWQSRLKLYNNQKRDKSRIGSPDIFTFHQTLLAHLYDDKLSVLFKGRMEKDDEAGENMTLLAEHDYDEARLAEVDYEWDFDSSLFGRGLLLMNDWDFKANVPLSEVIDPLTWLRDPNAQSVNGNVLGQNAMRFGGREIRRTYNEMFNSNDYFNLEYLKRDAQGFRTFSPLWDTERARKEAQGFNTPYQSYSLTTNLDWTLLQWFTIIENKRYMVELGNDRTLIIRMVELGKEWPIIDRCMYPIAHDWDGVSVFDIMEDKQRFRSQLLNVYGDLTKAKLYEMWLFDENKIRKNIDLDFELSKRIPVDGNPNEALVPVKHSEVSGDVNFMFDFLDKASQKALGVNDQTLGLPSGKRQTLGQLQQQQAKTDTRFSLTQKIWGWSEAKRWRRWYDMYEDNFGGIDNKIFTIEGAFGKPFEKDIRKEDITFSHALGPQIEIATKSETEAKKLRKYQQMRDYMGMAISLPETDKLYGMRKLGEQVLKKSEIKYLIPYTHDEMQALDENDVMNEGQPTKVSPEDNHAVHLRIHMEADENPESEAHIRAHQYALAIGKQRPDLIPGMGQAGQQGNPQDGGGGADVPSMGKSLAGPATEGMGQSLQVNKPK